MRHNLVATIHERFATQQAFAREIAVHPVRLNRICRGWSDPTAAELALMVKALDADPAWLFSKTTHIPRVAERR